jgi:RNA polymerase sigma-70 factor, ECF subfamily
MNILTPLAPTTATDRQALSRAAALHDAGLVRRFNTGDESAFTEIVTRYRARLLHTAFTLLHNQSDAEEIAQDTFLRAHRNLARFRGDSSLSVWLHCIALNLSRNRYWYFFRRKRHLTLSLDCTLSPGNPATFTDLVPSPEPDPVRTTTHREFSSVVAEAMTQLSAPQREILQLRNVRELSYGAIARSLAIKPGTVKSRVARARQNLRELLVKAYATGTARHATPPDGWFENVRAVARPTQSGSA